MISFVSLDHVSFFSSISSLDFSHIYYPPKQFFARLLLLISYWRLWHVLFCYFNKQDSEETVLPQDRQWPFLLRFPISCFGVCLGVSSQAILWKALATSPSTQFLHISLKINLVLWIISIALVAIIFTTYLLKIILYFEAVRREYYHPIRVNFFFAPWIALLFLALGVPPSVTKDLHHSLWYILMIPILCLEIKIYGQWMSGGQRRLSKVANPSNHLSIVGNFVGALLGASMGLKEGPIFFFAVGLAHYIVLFVTLYQRLPTNETLPKELHPVFFLFVAAPSVASMAWANIQGSFDYGSRIAYFIALFLYFSLVSLFPFKVSINYTYSLSYFKHTVWTISRLKKMQHIFMYSYCKKDWCYLPIRNYYWHNFSDSNYKRKTYFDKLVIHNND